MIVVSHESHDMYNPIFVLINLFFLKKTVRLLQLQNRNHMQLLQSQQTDRQKYATECYSAILTSRPRSTATVSLFESKEMKPSVTSKE